MHNNSVRLYNVRFILKGLSGNPTLTMGRVLVSHSRPISKNVTTQLQAAVVCFYKARGRDGTVPSRRSFSIFKLAIFSPERAFMSASALAWDSPFSDRQVQAMDRTLGRERDVNMVINLQNRYAVTD